MRLYELFLIETTEEDRAIISLSSSISEYLLQYRKLSGDQLTDVGTIGELFKTPLNILDPITIELESQDRIRRRIEQEYPDDVKSDSDNEVAGLWYADSKTIVLDRANIGTSVMSSIVTHELRHALDDFKSEFKASSSNSYTKPKQKIHRKTPDDLYMAQPIEINARFLQALNAIVEVITNSRRKGLTKEQTKDSAMHELGRAFSHYDIGEFFPNKQQSDDYKRLVKRAVDFVDKEIAHQIK